MTHISGRDTLVQVGPGPFHSSLYPAGIEGDNSPWLRSPESAEKKETQRARIKNTIASVGAIVSGLLLFVLPRTGTWVAIDLCVAWLFSLYCVWHCWGIRPTFFRRFGFFLLHVAFITVLGYAVWPRIKLSPSSVNFLGFPNETFNFSVRNERGDDIYDVQIPYLVGYGKHLQDKFSAKVIPNADPPQRLYGDYNYCFGVDEGNVSNIRPNEREVLIVRVNHLAPGEIRSFAITYAGGEKLEVKSGTPTFSSEPFSYSPNQSTIGVRGEYRICKFEMHTDGMVQR